MQRFHIDGFGSSLSDELWLGALLAILNIFYVFCRFWEQGVAYTWLDPTYNRNLRELNTPTWWLRCDYMQKLVFWDDALPFYKSKLNLFLFSLRVALIVEDILFSEQMVGSQFFLKD